MKIFPRTEYDLRVRRAKEFMERDGLDAIIATNIDNFLYLTGGWRPGFDPVSYMISPSYEAARPAMVIFPLDGDPVALVSKGFVSSSDRGWVDDVRSYLGLPFSIDYLVKELVEMGLSKARIGMELGEELRIDIPYVEFEKLRKNMQDATFTPSNIYWDLRIIKSEAEAEKIRKACEITGKAFEEFFPKLTENMKIRDVIKTLYECYMNAGATRPSFPPSLGLDYDEKTLKKGVEYRFDSAVVYDDYTADVCRMAIVGRATQHQKDEYEKCLKLNDAVCKASRAGVRTRDLWNIYLETLDELSVKGRERDRIGHGFGLAGNEPPSLGPTDDHVLQAGYVHCVEPGSINQGYYYIEEDLWVTEEGNINLSSSVTRELWEI
jgi:Xaa-Pro aminopeptidase